MGTAATLAELRARIASIEAGEGKGREDRTEEPRGSMRPSAAVGPTGSQPESDAGDEAQQAYRKILRLAAVRERATAQLRARLSRDGFSPAAVEEALGRASRVGVVDDARFAESLVRMRLTTGRGRRGIEAELEALDIELPGEEVWCAAGAGGEDEELSRAQAVLERTPLRAKNQRDAAYRKLVQKGYSSSVASTAARIWSEGHRSLPRR